MYSNKNKRTITGVLISKGEERSFVTSAHSEDNFMIVKILGGDSKRQVQEVIEAAVFRDDRLKAFQKMKLGDSLVLKCTIKDDKILVDTVINITERKAKQEAEKKEKFGEYIYTREDVDLLIEDDNLNNKSFAEITKETNDEQWTRLQTLKARKNMQERHDKSLVDNRKT